jgi:hypothetical protein
MKQNYSSILINHIISREAIAVWWVSPVLISFLCYVYVHMEGKKRYFLTSLSNY